MFSPEQAMQTSAGSGQSYNQIALLEANRGDKLGCVFFYVRSVCLKFPFPAAASNLGRYFNQILDEIKTWPIKDAKANAQTFIPYMLRFQGLLHHASHLKTAAKICRLLNESLNSLIAAEQLTSGQLIQLVSINMFLAQSIFESNPDLDSASKDELEIVGLVCESMAAMLNAFLLPVYTLKQGKALLNYFALPATKLILDWIVLNSRVLNERGFLRRMQIWPSLCRMLNELSEVISDRDELLKTLDKYPTPEDYDLQAFSPLWPRLKTFNFKQVTKKTVQSPNEETIQFLRAKRLLDLGQELAADSFEGKRLISSNEDLDQSSSKLTFKPVEQQIPESLLKELDNFALESSSEEEDNHEESRGNDQVEVEEESSGTKSKIAGILKVNPPSPEKSNASDASKADSTANVPQTTVTGKKVSTGSRTNVAMAAIMRQAQANAHRETSPEKENRQVTFKSTSPAPVASSHAQKKGGGAAMPDFSRPPPGGRVPRPSLGMVAPASSNASPSQPMWPGGNSTVVNNNKRPSAGPRPHGRYQGGLGMIPDRASTDTFYGGQRPPRMRPRSEEPGSVMGGPGFNSPQRFSQQSHPHESRNHNQSGYSDYGYDLNGRHPNPPGVPYGGTQHHHHNKSGGGNMMYYNSHPAGRGVGSGSRGENPQNQLLHLLGQTNGGEMGGGGGSFGQAGTNNGYQPYHNQQQLQRDVSAPRSNHPPSSASGSGGETGSYSLFSGSSWSGGPSSVLGSFPREQQQQQHPQHGGGGGNLFGSGPLALESLLNQQRKQ